MRDEKDCAGPLRPSCQTLRILKDIHRHFIIACERLFRIGTERFHAVFAIRGDSNGCDLEVQAPVINGEENALW